MPIMITFRTGRVALIALLAALATGCSREQQDWRSAEAADTSEAYGRFVEQHPDSELAVRARERLAQIEEERDWAEAGRVATVDAYRQFLGRHPSGKWSEEARIRIEAFSLGSAPRIGGASAAAAGSGTIQGSSGGVRALQLATQATPPPVRGSGAPTAASQLLRAEPAKVATAPLSGRNAPAAAAAAAAGGSTYGVQLGAFGSHASADREWRRLQGRFGAQLGGLSPRIVPAGGATGQLYRLQASAAGEAQARAICDSLKQRAQPCVPVLPH
jgi:cell division septation protein DedD